MINRTTEIEVETAVPVARKDEYDSVMAGVEGAAIVLIIGKPEQARSWLCLSEDRFGAAVNELVADSMAVRGQRVARTIHYGFAGYRKLQQERYRSIGTGVDQRLQRGIGESRGARDCVDIRIAVTVIVQI